MALPNTAPVYTEAGSAPRAENLVQFHDWITPESYNKLDEAAKLAGTSLSDLIFLAGTTHPKSDIREMLFGYFKQIIQEKGLDDLTKLMINPVADPYLLEYQKDEVRAVKMAGTVFFGLTAQKLAPKENDPADAAPYLDAGLGTLAELQQALDLAPLRGQKLVIYFHPSYEMNLHDPAIVNILALLKKRIAEMMVQYPGMIEFYEGEDMKKLAEVIIDKHLQQRMETAESIEPTETNDIFVDEYDPLSIAQREYDQAFKATLSYLQNGGELKVVQTGSAGAYSNRYERDFQSRDKAVDRTFRQQDNVHYANQNDQNQASWRQYRPADLNIPADPADVEQLKVLINAEENEVHQSHLIVTHLQRYATSELAAINAIRDLGIARREGKKIIACIEPFSLDDYMSAMIGEQLQSQEINIPALQEATQRMETIDPAQSQFAAFRDIFYIFKIPERVVTKDEMLSLLEIARVYARSENNVVPRDTLRQSALIAQESAWYRKADNARRLRNAALEMYQSYAIDFPGMVVISTDFEDYIQAVNSEKVMFEAIQKGKFESQVLQYFNEVTHLAITPRPITAQGVAADSQAAPAGQKFEIVFGGFGRNVSAGSLANAIRRVRELAKSYKDVLFTSPVSLTLPPSGKTEIISNMYSFLDDLGEAMIAELNQRISESRDMITHRNLQNLMQLLEDGLIHVAPSGDRIEHRSLEEVENSLKIAASIETVLNDNTKRHEIADGDRLLAGIEFDLNDPMTVSELQVQLLTEMIENKLIYPSYENVYDKDFQIVGKREYREEERMTAEMFEAWYEGRAPFKEARDITWLRENYPTCNFRYDPNHQAMAKFAPAKLEKMQAFDKLTNGTPAALWMPKELLKALWTKRGVAYGPGWYWDIGENTAVDSVEFRVANLPNGLQSLHTTMIERADNKAIATIGGMTEFVALVNRARQAMFQLELMLENIREKGEETGITVERLMYLLYGSEKQSEMLHKYFRIAYPDIQEPTFDQLKEFEEKTFTDLDKNTNIPKGKAALAEIQNVWAGKYYAVNLRDFLIIDSRQVGNGFVRSTASLVMAADIDFYRRLDEVMTGIEKLGGQVGETSAVLDLAITTGLLDKVRKGHINGHWMILVSIIQTFERLTSLTIDKNGVIGYRKGEAPLLEANGYVYAPAV